MYYNKELFDEADLEYPPAAYGEPYADGDPWDMDKVAELALLLTVDANGNDATSPDFDPENVVQWGFHHQFNDDARAIGTFFGPGTFVADDGTAQIPENWLAAWQWYVDLIDRRRGAEPVADRHRHARRRATPSTPATWRWPSPTCGTRAASATRSGNGRDFWDIAVVPEYNGEATSKLHADTFRILASTENPEAAFEVLTYLLDDAAPVLLDTYGGLPARDDLREPFFARLDELFPQGVNWEAALAGLDRPDVPEPRGQHAQLRRGRGRDRRVRGPPHDGAGPRRRRGRGGAARRARRGVRRRPGPDRSGNRTCGQRTRRDRTCRDGAGNDVGLRLRRTLEACDDVDH